MQDDMYKLTGRQQLCRTHAPKSRRHILSRGREEKAKWETWKWMQEVRTLLDESWNVCRTGFLRNYGGSGWVRRGKLWIRAGDENAARGRGGMTIRSRYEQPEGLIMQTQRRRRSDGMKGRLKGWSAHPNVMFGEKQDRRKRAVPDSQAAIC